jgi:mono/diheme cytochrome c family protein
MKTLIALSALTVATLLAVGCGPNIKSGRGFQLPTGDAEKGKAAFIQMKCTECHRVEGVTLPAPTARPELTVTLGGEVSRLRTYGQLVTAIIHPGLEISEKLPGPVPATGSPMKNFNREMTVAQLADIVTFLSPTYRLLVPMPDPSS